MFQIAKNPAENFLPRNVEDRLQNHFLKVPLSTSAATASNGGKSIHIFSFLATTPKRNTSSKKLIQLKTNQVLS